jgi:hypothetical protein
VSAFTAASTGVPPASNPLRPHRRASVMTGASPSADASSDCERLARRRRATVAVKVGDCQQWVSLTGCQRSLKRPSPLLIRMAICPVVVAEQDPPRRRAKSAEAPPADPRHIEVVGLPTYIAVARAMKYLE